MISPSRSVVDSTIIGVSGDNGGLLSSSTVRLPPLSVAGVSSSLLSSLGSLTTGIAGVSAAGVFSSLIAAVYLLR